MKGGRIDLAPRQQAQVRDVGTGRLRRDPRRPCCVKTSSSRFHRAALSSFRRSLGRPSAQLGCGRVLATFLWHRLAILNVAVGTIDHELGELGEVARAFEAGTTAARSAALIVPSCEGFLVGYAYPWCACRTCRGRHFVRRGVLHLESGGEEQIFIFQPRPERVDGVELLFARPRALQPTYHFLTVCSIAPLSVLSRECQCIIDRSKCPPRVTERADSAIRFAADLQLRVDKEFSFVGHFRNKPTIVSSVPAVSGLFGIRIAVH